MMERFRAFWAKVFTPVAQLFLRWASAPTPSPGRARSASAPARWCSSRAASFLVGVLVVTAFVFSDLVDGTMARLSGQLVEAGARSSTRRWTGSATRRSSAAWRVLRRARRLASRWPRWRSTAW